MKYSAFVILAIALIVSCSGGDKSTGPEYTPNISTSPGVVAFTSAAEAYKLPDPVAEVFTNNTEDTLRCYLTHSGEWLHLGVDTLYLLPHTSRTVPVSVKVDGLPVMMYQDTLFLFNAADSTRMRYVPVRLTVIVNNTYLTTSDPDLSYEYLGLQDDNLHWYHVTCSWTMICHSNGGNPAHVFEYLASGNGGGLTWDVDLNVLPDESMGQQVRASIEFYIGTERGPYLWGDWEVGIGYHNALGEERWVHISYHS